MGAIEKTIQALVDQVGSACQVVAICGRNKGLIKRLEAKQYPAGMQVQHAKHLLEGQAHTVVKLLPALRRPCLQAHPVPAMHSIWSHVHHTSKLVLSRSRLNKNAFGGSLAIMSCVDLSEASGTYHGVSQQVGLVSLLHRLQQCLM